MKRDDPKHASIAFDESGNTGENLLDQNQPLYCLASINVDEEKADELARGLLLPGQSELKFSSLRGSRIGRDHIVAGLSSGLLTPDTARVTPTHKPFMVVAKLFDEMIEPALFERGIEIYDSGGHVQLANYLYRAGPRACGVDRWNALLTAFVAAERHQTEEEVSAFLAALRTCQITAAERRVRKLLDLIDPKHVRWAIDLQRNGGAPLPYLDPAAPSLIEHCIVWGQRVGCFRVIHDETPVLIRLAPVIERLAAPSAREYVGAHWARQMSLPLKVSEVRSVCSHDSRRVQLADLVAGACVVWLNRAVSTLGDDRDFATALGRTCLPELIENEIWFEPISPYGE